MGFEPEEEDQDEDDPTKALLSKYTPTPTPNVGGASGAGGASASGGPMTPRITDRTPARPDVVRTEAENLRALTESSTPLIGGENAPLHPSDFSGATPRRLDISTPNPLVTPFRTPAPVAGAITPIRTPARGSATPRRTPLRDQLNINEGSADFGEEEELEQKNQDTVQQLQKGLASLPKPSNEYRVAMPDLDDFEMDVEEEDVSEKKSQKGIISPCS